MKLVLPILIPLVTGALCLVAWRRRTLQRWLGCIGAFLLLAASLDLLHAVATGGVLVVRVAGWPAPFAIVLVADLLAALMVAVTGVVGAAVAVYSIADMDARREALGYYGLFHVLLMGVCGAFLTGDIFNLYVWFEVMLIASFVLLALGGTRGQIEGALKYVTLNLMSSALFLAAVGLLYSIDGTLSMASLAQVLRTTSPELVTVLSMLFLVAFGTKAAIFPLFFWLPASYHTPPVAVSAVFAGLLTKVGVYALIRAFTLLFVGDVAYTHMLILVLSGLTMVTGVLGAVAQNEFRRILAFHIVSQIGYMILGLGLFTRMALAGSVFYIVHHIIVKTNLFLISGIAHRLGGSFELGRLGGLYARHPALAVLFLIPAMSLAGIPPLSGFFAKLALVRAGIEAESYTIVAVSLAVGLLTLLSMTKIWGEAFWKDAPEGAPPARRAQAALWIPAVALAALTLAIGAAAGFCFDLALRAADQLLDPGIYIRAVLGDQP
jgi:multicomponent Na+:H+ antiporter subunit D